jgi:hypothetical protein
VRIKNCLKLMRTQVELKFFSQGKIELISARI